MSRCRTAVFRVHFTTIADVRWLRACQTLYDNFDDALKKRAPKIKYPKYANVR